MPVDVLIDKALIFGDDMALNNRGDLVIIKDREIILQSAQNRCLSLLGTRPYDDKFGCEMMPHIWKSTPWQVTNAMAKSYITQALKPMMDDGRIETVDSVKILERSDVSLFIEIILTIGTIQGTITIEVPVYPIQN